MNDTTTTLNPGVGGDVMDESEVLQSDGETLAKRPRVDVGFGASEANGRLVDNNTPLPVEDRNAAALEKIAADIHAIRELIEMALS